MPAENYLFLTADKKLIKDQIGGLPLGPDQALRLEPNISTDAIFPTKGATSPYGEFGNFALSNLEPIREGDLKRMGPSTLVVGNGFGSGSSREHAPLALKQAGIKTIVCVGGRVERIFLENCLMSGIRVFEKPDLSETVGQIEKAIQKDELEKIYQDSIRPDIEQVGGISSYTRMRLEGRVEPAKIRHSEVEVGQPMTATEKILAKQMSNVEPNIHGQKVVRPGDTGFVRLGYRMSYELHTAITQSILDNQLEGLNTKSPENVHLFQDHTALAAATDPKFAKLVTNQQAFAANLGLRVHTPTGEIQGSDGICHTIAVEQALLKPGEVGVGTDSHTCSLGVLNALAWGIGATHFANTLVTNEALIEVPKSIKITLNGKLKNEVSVKDVMLYILSQDFVKNGSSTNTVFEYSGEGLDEMSLGEQIVLTNMAVEGRGMTGIIARPTPALRQHMSQVSGWDGAEFDSHFVAADKDAFYDKTLEIDLNNIEPMVATPGDPRNGIPLSELKTQKVRSVYIGSCTGGNLEDLRRVSETLKGKKVNSGVKLYVQPASQNILDKAIELGYINIFQESGAEVVGLGCGACIGLGPGKVPDGDNNGVTVSATNRNFPRRMGGNGPVLLVSPTTATKSAIVGYIGDNGHIRDKS